jgi:hypothetical protein
MPARRFVTRIAVIAVVATFVSSGFANAQLFYSTSNTRVPPSESFLLGGDQRRPLRVIGTNTGTVDVSVYSTSAEGNTLMARAAPGETFSAVFPVGATAKITNTSSTEQAQVRVRFNADTSQVGMRYVPSENDEPD